MIQDLRLLTVFNLLGKPTLKAKVFTECGCFSASVPSGTSKGACEAVDLPPHKARKAFPQIRKGLIGRDEKDWLGVDSFLQETDGTGNFSRIGGNLALAVSLAVARAAKEGDLWKVNGKGTKAQFPVPVCNMIGGGKHGGLTRWQEFLVIPHRARSPAEAMKTLAEIWSAVGDELRSKGFLLGRNMENAWTSELDDARTLDFLSQVAHDWDTRLGVDFAASSLWSGKGYDMPGAAKPDAYFDAVMEAARKYKLFYLEDPFHENDFRAFSDLNAKLGRKALVVGDDLYCTMASRILEGTESKATNAAIIKPNQVGTLKQTTEAVEAARSKGMAIVPSHRSAETPDHWISDLAVTFDAPLIKIGLGDIPKYNRLIELWEEIAEVGMAKPPF
jgi:enolase